MAHIVLQRKKMSNDLPAVIEKSENVPPELVDLAIYLHLYVEC